MDFNFHLNSTGKLCPTLSLNDLRKNCLILALNFNIL